MKPHGLDLIMKEELLENGKVVHSSEKLQGSFEGWISITNKKKNKYIELPMRSFVQTFIDKLHGILSGDAGEDTKISTCSTASMAVHRAGLVLGTGVTPPALADTSIETVASDASLAYGSSGTVTFQAPAEVLTNPPGTSTEIRHLIQNNKGSAFYISEIALYGKKNASAAAGGAQMFARDLIGDEAEGGVVNFAADSDMRFDFKFKTTMSSTGGLTLNFSRLVTNLFFKGAATPAVSGFKIKSVISTNPTYTYGNASKAASTDFPYIKGGATQYYWGVVVADSRGSTNDPGISIDHTTFGDWLPEDFTCSANNISAVGVGSGTAYFTVSRTFTNASTTAKYIDRVGILCKGVATGGVHTASAATLNSNQFLITANTPTTGSVVVQPNQTYRVTYTFQIQV